VALFSSVERDSRLRTSVRTPGAPVLAPGPTPAATATTIGRTNPDASSNALLAEAPQTSQSRSNATVEARKAAERQRKKAAGGRTVVTGQPVGPGINPPGTFQPRTLLGGGY
jgi:hypothetical protein